MGPTAVGKTEISLALAGNGFEIISADSVQVYKYLDIGSGKPDRADRERVRHHLIDCVEPDVPFTAGEFCREAGIASRDMASRGMKPMIVGGTGLYIDSFFHGLSEIPEVSPEVRETVRGELLDRGLQLLYEELTRIDPVFAARVHPNDTQRITRGLEVFRGTGRPLSSYFDERRRYGTEDSLFIGLHEDRSVLRSRIDARVDRMIDRGLVDEVRGLRERGFGPELQSMKSIGYAEINAFIDGDMDLRQAVEKIKTATKQYAKRQMTWFRKNRRARWFRPNELEAIREYVRQWLNGRDAYR